MFLAFFIALFVILVGIAYVVLCVWYQDQHHQHLAQQLAEDECKSLEIVPDPSINLVILAPVRNAMPGLTYALSTFAKIKRVFPNTRCVFVENDSTDGTRECIEQDFPNILPTVIVDGPPADPRSRTWGKSCSRVQRMATLRNLLMEQVQAKDDWIMCIDPDWCTVVPIESIMKAIYYMRDRPEVNGISPVFRRSTSWLPFCNIFFDTFAYEDEQTKTMSPHKKAVYLQTKDLLHPKGVWPKDQEGIPVLSAFGCLGMYRHIHPMPRYEAWTLDPEKPLFNKDDWSLNTNCQCEHKSFQQQLGSIHLLPWFEISVH